MDLNERLKAELAKMRKDDPFSKEEQKKLDKFQVITSRFIDTLHGHLAGNHPATSIDNVRAVCELISGLAQHLQRKGLLPSDLDLVYKFTPDPDSDPSDLDLVSIDIRKDARASSNFAKHADRDADQTHAFNIYGPLDMLTFNMVQDYETLHSAMINGKILDCTNEELYPIKRSFLIDLHKYKNIFHPYYSSGGEDPDDSSLHGMFVGTMLRVELSSDKGECHVPAGTVACIIYRANDLEMYSRESKAKKMRELGIWPVQTAANASMMRDYIAQPKQDLEM